MAWDFSTEPEFEQQLDWMRTFVREEIWPLETVAGELDQAELDRIYAPLQEQVRQRGLWAAHLAPELGGQGFGQVKLGLMHEILGTSPFAPNAFGCQAPDSGNSEILALAGTPEQKEHWLEPLLAGDLQIGVLDDRARDRRLRPDAAADARGARRRRLRDQRAQVVHVERLDRRLPDRDGRHRPRGAAPPARVDVHRAGRHPGREHPARRADDGAPAGASSASSAATPRSSTTTCGSRPPTAARQRGRGLPDRPAAPLPGRIHHCMRWLGVARRAFDMLCERATYRVAHGKVLGEHQSVQNWIADSAAHMQAARLMTLHAAWVMDTRARPRRARRSR